MALENDSARLRSDDRIFTDVLSGVAGDKGEWSSVHRIGQWRKDELVVAAL